MQRNAHPVTDPIQPDGSVRTAGAADKRWAELANQLTPAASLVRIDTATARAVTTITVIGTLLTGLGAVSADQLTTHARAATILAVATVILSTLSVASALIAQILTISRHINPANLAQVRAWYHRQFTVRAYATQAATILLIIAALLSGATAATALLAGNSQASVHTPVSSRP